MLINYSQQRESESEGEKANTERKKEKEKDFVQTVQCETKINTLKGYQLVISHKTPLFTSPTYHHPRIFLPVIDILALLKKKKRNDSVESARVNFLDRYMYISNKYTCD